MKCVVKDCENHSHQGKFVGELCSPCFRFISGDGGLHSQAHRNTHGMILKAVEMERDLCAMVSKKHSHREDDMGAIIERAIRARGQA